MILVNDVVEACDLVRHGRYDAMGLIASITALSVPLFSISALSGLRFARCLVEETLRHQQEVDGLALFVASAVGILLDALDLDVRLIQTPVAPDRRQYFWIIFSTNGGKRIAQRSIDECSTETPRSCVIFLRCRSQRVGRMPADSDQDHIDKKAHQSEVEHGGLSWVGCRSSPTRSPGFAYAKESMGPATRFISCCWSFSRNSAVFVMYVPAESQT